ncbi:hypothetical protein CPAR01_02983 [Colletotrichum paranaense]|uniref:Uncharacterized protein n=4 Tax=Colletotrichum acutatum species complex TaxID=2707335 RepID=A0AAI9YL78_9PEZI|nr:uncharacterized protein CCOS01_13762 [Colletotrichum costaricense]XP_060354598.1 uncharacterized protein CPAR01_02983 [Colletotrichum paranaense]XP_060389096.1 uncharacterized protein CTAM01_00418 [Colletotrichum tamarilloi]KAI3545035.1 hypothetical protein CSPX01_05241 [Colletotrichum filicis]KAK1451968.1 hypothetical protein CMEL01_06542 [Colletotrichum melonis]KAK1513022.1 hypothetical protein CTAM01_00418 [Colletotrichum tamarilloi]KAK1514481.1 hypothetical protein CCOS01_13762 [Collet
MQAVNSQLLHYHSHARTAWDNGQTARIRFLLTELRLTL